MGFLQISGLGKIHFHEYGAGTKPMLAFHGYGMTGRQFHVLEKSVLSHYHIYGFDHFFHHESKLDNWTEQQILTGMPKVLVREYVEEWFKIYGRQRFSLMAYSVGAKLALILIEEYADLIDDIILMAPDGISVHKGFYFLTDNLAGKQLFKWVSKSEWLAPAMLKGMKKMRFIDDSLHKIAYSEIDTPKKRLDVYYTLNLIRRLTPDVNKVAELINKYQINCTIIFGKNDHLFPKASAATFTGLLPKATVFEVPFGHWLVTKELDKYLIGNGF
jgi:pimeloyl-ACP methyl ester carboxylesterase